jgi:hypothetical protein
VVNFFKKELQAGRDNYLRRRILRYKIDGRRRWWMSARRENAYVWQNGRFNGDETFWKDRLGQEADVVPVKAGSCLRFFLRTEQQFREFLQAVTSAVKEEQFVDNGEVVEEEAEA